VNNYRPLKKPLTSRNRGKTRPNEIEERVPLTQGLKREELNIDYCLLTIEGRIPLKQGLKLNHE